MRLVLRDLKLRYRNSVLGFCWSFLNPLAQVLVFTILFKYILERPDPDYSIHLFCKLMPWLFFAQALEDGGTSVAKNIALVKKIYFPRDILPLASLLSNFVHFVAGMAVLFIILLILPFTFHWVFFWLIPLVLLQMLLTYGLSLMLSSVSVFYRDIQFFMGVGVRLWFFLSPVLFTVEEALGSKKFGIMEKTIFLLNPMAPIMAIYHSIIFDGGKLPITQPQTYLSFPAYLGIAVAVSLLSLLIGYAIFRRYEWWFPERVL